MTVERFARFCADLAVIAIAIVLCLHYGGAI